MRKAVFILLTIASLGVAAYAIVAYTLFPVGSLVHPEMKATYAIHRIGILTHIFASSITLLLGPWQFIPTIRARWPQVHRNMGRVYLALGVLPGGLAGLYMAMHAFGGIVSHTGFALSALLWLFTGYRAYAAARSRDFVAHRAWMIRNFALALGAVTLRVQLGTCFAAKIPFETFYPVLAWTAWVPNLFVAEWIVRPSKNR